MRKTTYQVPEIRDENNNIIQEGTFGRTTAFVTADNHGVLDYLINNLEALRDIITGAYIIFESRDSFPTAGDPSKIYVSREDGKVYRWNGTNYEYIAAEATAVTALDVKKMKEEAADSASNAFSSATAAKQSETTAKEYAKNAADALSEVNSKATAVMTCEGFKFVVDADGNVSAETVEGENT